MARADCPLCSGTGWKLVPHPQRSGEGAGQLAVRCECTLTNRTSRALSAARIPPRYEPCDFENFDVDVYAGEQGGDAWDQSLKQVRLVTQTFTRDYPVSADAGLLLMGPCGVGKTHLAVAALKEIVLRGHSGVFYDYRELLKEIQSSYDPEAQTTEMQILDPVLTVDLLLLDDLGASKPSAWALETVGMILNARYNSRRLTLITTNYLDTTPGVTEIPRQPSGQPVSFQREESLADRVGQRIRSRLYEMCRTVEIQARDYRSEVRQAGRFRA